jgi:nitrate reductase gamma subunit
MNLGKQVNSVRRHAGGGIVSVLILFSPVAAFFVLIAAEALVDVLLVAGNDALCAVAAGLTGLVLSRKLRGRVPGTQATEDNLGRIAHV